MNTNYPDFIPFCEKMGLRAPIAEFEFHSERKWRFDFCWPEKKLALEVEGGAWVSGRHNSPEGFIGDMKKYNEAAIAGWRILRVPPKTLISIITIDLVRRATT